MPYEKGDENKYFPTVIAALIVLAVVIGGVVFTLLNGAPENLDQLIITEENGVTMIDPGPGLATPDGPPNIDQPTTLPPDETN